MLMENSTRFLDPLLSTEQEIDYRRLLEDYIANSPGTNVEKMQCFTKYIPVQDLRRFLCKHEIYKRILHVHGSIIECGVAFGGGLMGWDQMCEIYEPINRVRQIYGFDTFSGFPNLAEQDKGGLSSKCNIGGFAIDSFEDIKKCIALQEKNKVLRHIQRTHLIKGDANETIPLFIQENPHLVVSLLYLDFDIYEPTRVALRHFLPRMPKGAIIAFDELNDAYWPGETIAVCEEIGLQNLRIQRFSEAGTMSFAVIE